MVEFSWPRKRNFSKPPRGGSLLRISWLWVYWPRRMVALLGQHRELVTKALSKVVPLSMSSDSRLGMCRSARGFRSFTARSSVRIRITLGDFGSCFWFSACFPSAEGKQAERAQATATPRSAYTATKSILLVRSTTFTSALPDGAPRGAVRTSFSYTPGRVFASFFESLDLPGLCYLQVKCYTFPRWASPIPEDRRSAMSWRQGYTRTGHNKQAPAERRLISDLLHALSAAFLIGVLPGWFWTRCLLASGDRAEQLAYTVALSLTLVPTVALAQTHLFATGVTFAVTVVSVALVFLAGLAAYLLFGPAKKSEEPISLPPSPPGLPTLAPLAAALALALLMFFGIAPTEWLMIPIAVLVIAAGIAYWSTRQGRDAPPAELGGSVPAAGRYALLSLVLLLVLARGYLGPIVNGWPYPRGVDRYEHAVMAGMMMREGSNESFMLYPPGFHLLTAMISRLSGIEPLELFPILAPMLPSMGALACYALAKRLWGWEYGVAAAFTSGLLLGGTFLHFEEARYPNFIGEYFLIVLAVAALVGMYASPSARAGLLLALLGSSTVLYHQIAGYSLAVLLGLICVLFLPYLLIRDRKKGVYLALSLALLSLLSVVYAWDTYDLPSLVAGMLGGSETGRGGEAVAMAIGTKPANGPGHFLTTMSHPVLWLGLLGLSLMLAGGKNARDTPDILARLTLLVWTLLLFFGSLTS